MKLILNCCLVAVLAATLAGCGSQNKAAAPQRPTSSTQAQTPTAAAEPVPKPDPAPGQPAPAPAAEATPAKATVVIKLTGDMRFVPASVTVVVGQTVEWENVSTMPHTVTADPAQAGDAKNVKLPVGAKTFDSGSIKPGNSFKYVFSVPGTYKYVCVAHEALGMLGEIVVNPAK